MYLRMLNNEQKQLVLGLAVLAMKANDVIDSREEEMLRLYADEMGIQLEDASKLPVEEICSRLIKISNEKEINQIVFEITAMMLSDYEFDELERDFMNNIIAKLGISTDKINTMETYIKDYMDLVKKINILMMS